MFWHEGQSIYNGKYQIEKQLGFGGFALTYKATHTQLNRPVVIKTPNISVQNDPEYPKYVERFKKEAQMLAQCCSEPHPHIVQVFDFFEVDGRYCLEMQYIEGLSLWDYVKNKGKLPEAEAVKYIQQIGLALIEVHKNGIFHLDVTPPNIMITGDTGLTNSGKAVLIDFGIAADMSPPSTLSRTFGNKAFSPYHELRKGIRAASIDVYCLAASLYYAVTGQQPTNALDRKLYDEELISPQQLVTNLSDAVNEVILQGLALDAKDRPQTIQEWLNPLSFSLTEKVSNGTAGNVLEINKKNITVTLDDDFETDKTYEFEKKESQMILISDVGEDYSKLDNLLKTGQWKEADKETARLMLKIARREEEGWLDANSIKIIPCNDLLSIDRLWKKYSNARFGFSIQKEIWVDCGGNIDIETDERLAKRLGWKFQNGRLKKYDELDFSLNALKGHLPAQSMWSSAYMFGVTGFRIFWCSSIALRLMNCNM